MLCFTFIIMIFHFQLLMPFTYTALQNVTLSTTCQYFTTDKDGQETAASMASMY